MTHRQSISLRRGSRGGRRGVGAVFFSLQACGVRLQPDSQPRGGEMERRRPAG